ncbi:hypothetical protein BDD12DRAFT_556194 [Trichophaea hybrida]|nr:hypothetical protein BDD12DRAFT_556194 [Trichophaea hybrida]
MKLMIHHHRPSCANSPNAWAAAIDLCLMRCASHQRPGRGKSISHQWSETLGGARGMFGGASGDLGYGRGALGEKQTCGEHLEDMGNGGRGLSTVSLNRDDRGYRFGVEFEHRLKNRDDMAETEDTVLEWRIEHRLVEPGRYGWSWARLERGTAGSEEGRGRVVSTVSLNRADMAGAEDTG